VALGIGVARELTVVCLLQNLNDVVHFNSLTLDGIPWTSLHASLNSLQTVGTLVVKNTAVRRVPSGCGWHGEETRDVRCGAPSMGHSDMGPDAAGGH
jgi:hypothetical protein